MNHLYDDDGRFLGFCYTHGGVRVLPQGEESCQHEQCLKLRKLEFQTPVFASVPGGATANVDHHRANERGLEEYAAARKAGMQPRTTKPGAVREMEQEIASQQRALTKLEEMGNDTSELKVHKGVR